jgi:polyisoprenyl-teichoic acid--peptidoglycan teichoic acid transferase
MKRPTRRTNPWKKGYARPHRRERTAVYPLARRGEAVDSGLGFHGFDATTEFHVPDYNPLESGSFRDQPRGVRFIAWTILIAVPLITLAWVGSVVVPIVWESQQAAGKVFIAPVERVSFVTPVATVPVVPGDTPTTAPTVEPGLPTATTRSSDPTATTQQPQPTPLPEWSGRDPINILLLGVDRRVGDEGPPRSDTIIVVHVDPVAKRVDMLSIPRDLLVQIPGYYATKINAAYPFGELDESVPGGGPTLVAQTVEYNFGIPIHYFAEVDIAGMEKVVDTIGGVMIDVPGIVKDDQYPTEDSGFTRVQFTPGLQLMDGVTAVRYARTRHDGGDFARQTRQQQMLLAIRERALATGLITNLPDIISELGDSIRTDILGDDPSFRKLYQLARLGQDIGRANIYSHSLGGYVYEELIDGGYYLVGDWEVIRALAADLPSDPNGVNGFETPEQPADLDE